MQYLFVKVLYILLLLVIVACGGSSPKSISLKDSSLDNAPIIEEVSQLTSFKVASNVYTQGIAPISNGFVVYIQRDNALGDNGTRIVRINMETKKQELLYEGNRGIESVAVSADGGFVVFTALLNEQYDVFAYDLTGKVFKKGEIFRLTNTTTNESHVSMALDKVSGLMPLAWQAVVDDKNTETITTNVLVAKLRSSKISKQVLGFDFEGKRVNIEQPSINGGGNLALAVAKVPADKGNRPILVLWNLRTFSPKIVYNDLLVKEINTPSLNYEGTTFLFTEHYDGKFQLTYQVIDLGFAKLKENILVNHPYLTAGGHDYAYAIEGTVYVAKALDSTPEILVSDFNGLVDAAPYWAKIPTLEQDELLIYSESLSHDSPFFSRPDPEGYGLKHDERTVSYHLFAFKVPKEAVYAIESVQDYDGYISLYTGDFNAEEPERGLFTTNDNFDIGFSPGPPPLGKSKIFAQLKQGVNYAVVTSSCGHNESICGPSLGSFTNKITITDEPIIPDYVLPDPDPTKFNIHVRFAQDALTKQLSQARRQTFQAAAVRWESIISKDLQDIKNFKLPILPDFEVSPNVVGTLDDVFIDVRVSFDFNKGVLARANTLLVRKDGSDKQLPVYGYVELSAVEFTGGGLADNDAYQQVVEHEIGHVLGIGTLWDASKITNYLPNPPKVEIGLPNNNYDPGFIGINALQEFNILREQIFLPALKAVPVANTGTSRNYNVHWREFTFLNEIMTPYKAAPELLSRVTAASLEDLGYEVNMDSPAIDKNYKLTPRFPAHFGELLPRPKTYIEFKDFYALIGKSASAKGKLEVVDVVLVSPYSNTSGCSKQDFQDFTPKNIVIIQRGGCSVEQKLANAKEALAAGVILFNQGTKDRQGLFIAENTESFPVIIITYALGKSMVERIKAGEEITVAVKVNGEGALENTSSKAYQEFKEEVLGPVGTVSIDGTIYYHY